MNAEPRVAIVTGGRGGLGVAISQRLLADGLRVVTADTNGAFRTRDDRQTMALEVDVTDIRSVRSMVSATVKQWGRIDVLVNNAGIAGPTAPVADYPHDDFRRVIDVNLLGVFNCTQACLPDLQKQSPARIVNVASVAGRDPNPEMSAYSASKAGVIAFTRSLAKELAGSDTLANCVVPGVVDAGLTRRASEAERRSFLARVPMGRMARAEEIAELVSWVASPLCSFSTGAVFDATGGRGPT